MSYKRKYKIGDKVESLDELTQQNFVYIYNHPKAIRHISVIESMTFRTVMRFLSMGMYKAVRVEDGET